MPRRGLPMVAALLFGAMALPALAQDAYPSKPVRLLVPFPPGGVVDILARLVAPRMADGLKQNVVVDNRPGANGNIAVDLVAKSQPDGYTLLFAQVSNLAVNPAVYPNVPFDPIRDLAPIALVASAPQLMVVAAESKLRGIADVLVAARTSPGQVTFASSGNGSMAHMGLELMQQSAGIKFLHVPYKGAAPAVIDVMGGRADLFMAAMPSVMPQVRAGKLRGLAVTSGRRVPDLPDVPTLAESGFPGYDSSNWFAVLGRAGTAPSIIARLNGEVNRAIEAGEVRAKLASEGALPLGGSPDDLARQLAADVEKWARVVKEAGIKLE